MSVARGWHKISRGWWWWSHGEGVLADGQVAYHVDLTVIIWPFWRYSVCRWIGCRPKHGVREGWRFGRERTKRAAEWALARLGVVHQRNQEGRT